MARKMTKTQENALKVKAVLDTGYPVLMYWKWTTSKARDTYGYNICTCIVNGAKVGRCDGGGYDMRGWCFGEFMNNAFPEELKTLDKEKEYYGLHQYDGKVNGACGLSTMKEIFEALGYDMVYHRSSKNDDEYILKKKEENK